MNCLLILSVALLTSSAAAQEFKLKIYPKFEDTDGGTAAINAFPLALGYDPTALDTIHEQKWHDPESGSETDLPSLFPAGIAFIPGPAKPGLSRVSIQQKPEEDAFKKVYYARVLFDGGYDRMSLTWDPALIPDDVRHLTIAYQNTPQSTLVDLVNSNTLTITEQDVQLNSRTLVITLYHNMDMEESDVAESADPPSAHVMQSPEGDIRIDTNHPSRLDVFDLHGRVVYDEQIPVPGTVIDSDLVGRGPGAHFLRVTSELSSQVLVKKIYLR